VSKERTILGHIDCPTCGTKGGMRITPDKNGDPFGYCEAECGQQLRVGGDRRRVAAFVKLYPWAGEREEPADPPASDPAPKPAPVAAPAPVPVQKKPARSPMADALTFLGMNTK
jgi:hypothetical protein